MSATPPRSPAEAFAAALRCLSHSVVTQGIMYRLTPLIVRLIIDRLRTAILGFARLASRIEAGTWRPRRTGPRRKPHAVKPRIPGPLPKPFGWLAALVPDAPQYRGMLNTLLQMPEMLALIEVAPAPMARKLRPLHWALGLKRPPILALPRPTAPPEPAPAEAPAPGPGPAPRPASPLPAPARQSPRPQRRLPGPCGPPLPA